MLNSVLQHGVFLVVKSALKARRAPIDARSGVEGIGKAITGRDFEAGLVHATVDRA